LFFIVNYRVDEVLMRCLRSLHVAQAHSSVELQVHVLDNSEYEQAQRQHLEQQALKTVEGLALHIHWPIHNAGYFGGLALAQELARTQGSDTVIYSNPDIEYAEDFFSQLQILAPIAPGLLAPAIVSSQDGFDQNPQYVQRLPASKLRRLKQIYARPMLFKAYMGLARLKEVLLGQRARPSHADGLRIYSAHGASMVFTNTAFFLSLPHYPCFLFGEELFVAEEAAQRGVPITYRPALRVRGLRSQSVRQLPSDFFRRLMLQSVEFILSKYHTKSP
jgi:GT2 family glycosyltransferase